jgi:hypothetical protein
MNRLELAKVIRKRATALDESGDPSAAAKYTYPIGDDGELGLASAGGLESAVADSAVFCVTDNSVDRDADRVNVHGILTRDWERAGAPIFWSHQMAPGVPIGSAIDPATRQLQFWIDGDRALCRIFFDMSDPFARLLASKVHRGLCRSVSCAFVPLRTTRRDESTKGVRWEGAPVGGFDFHEISITEISLVGVGANPNALLEGVPAGMAKSLRRCTGAGCFSRWIPPPRVQSRTATTHSGRLLSRLPKAKAQVVSPAVERKLKQLVATVNRIYGVGK